MQRELHVLAEPPQAKLRQAENRREEGVHAFLLFGGATTSYVTADRNRREEGVHAFLLFGGAATSYVTEDRERREAGAA